MKLIYKAALLAFQLIAFQAAVAANIWDGGGTNDNWGTATNWDNNVVPSFPAALTFAGTNRLTPNNNLSSLTVNGITFDAAAGTFTLGGNGISLGGNIGFNGNPATLVNHSINLDLTLTADRTFLTQSNGWLTVGGVISGNFGLTKQNDGVLQLSATNGYTGSTVINGGVVRLAGMTSVPTNFPGVQAYYTFNDANNLGLDSSGNNNTMITGAGAPIYTNNGKYSGALYLNSSSTMKMSVFPTGVPTNNSPYTIALWFKPDTGCSTSAGLVGWGSIATNRGNFLKINGSNDKINNYWGTNANNLVATSSGGSLFNGVFHHVAATFDGTNRVIYINGLAVATTNNPGFSTDLNVLPSGFEVGDCLSANRFKGWIDELTIANRAFGASELTNLMNQAYPTVPVANPAATVNLLPTNTALVVASGAVLDLNGGSQTVASLTGSGTVTNGSSTPGSLTLQNTNATTFAGAFEGALTVTKRGGGTLTLSGVNNHSGATVIEDGTLLLAAGNNTNLLSSLVAYYTFNTNGNLGWDSSGKGNTLITSAGTPAYSSAGKFGGALYLNGTSSMKVTSFPQGVPTNNAPYSIACWVKADVGCPNNAGIVGWGGNLSGKGNALSLNGNQNDVRNYWSGYDLVGAMSGGDFFDGSFDLVVATFDGTNRAIYINGLLVAATNNPGFSAILNVTPTGFEVGDCFSAPKFKGWMDNLMIANRAFSEAEVTSLLNQNLLPPVLPSDGSLQVTAPAVVDLNGLDVALGSLAGNGTITNSVNNAVTLTLGNAGTSTSFGGTIAATNLTLIKTGSGMQTFAGTNRYSGETLVNAGVLWLAGGSLDTSLVKVAGGPTFGSVPPKFGGAGTVAGSVNYLVDSCPVFTNGGTLVITGPMLANTNIVHLRLGQNVPAGNYLLATYNPAGSSGGFYRIPEVDSGSFAPYTQYYVTNGGGQVSLVVTSIPTNTPIAGVNVYEPVPGLAPSVQYAVRVCAATNTSLWNSVFTFQTRAQPSWSPDAYYDSIANWSHSYVNFEMTKPVTVEISKVNGQPITSAKVRPENKAKNVYVSGGKAYVTLNQPCNVAVDINGQMEDQYTGEIASPRQYYTGPPIHTISIHGNPVLANKPATNGANVLLVTPGTIPPQTGSWTNMYFLPGVHYIGTNFQVYPGKNYYIPGDAIVHGAFNNQESATGDYIRIFGHGTICGERFKHWTQVNGGLESLSYMEKGINIGSITTARIEGVSITDPANHSIILYGGSYNANNPAVMDWVKIVTWRANGDGINAFDNGLIKNCFIRTQDDGNYVNGHAISNLVMWVDANGSQMRLSALPNHLAGSGRTLPVDNIDLIYSRHKWWSHSSPLKLPDNTGDRGAGVIFSKLNFSDPLPSDPAIAIHMGTNGAFAGTLFKDVTIASTNKNRLVSQPGGSVHDLTFENLVVAGTLVTSNNWLNYFVTNATVDSVVYNGPVYNIFFTRTDFTAPVVTVTPGTTSFSSSLPVSLAVNGDYGYYSRNGGAYVAFTTAGADLLLTNTTTLSVYGRDVIGNVSGTNTYIYTLNLPPSPPAVLTGVTMSPGGNLSFSVTNAGGIYRVQTHTNLANPAGWVTISTNTAPFTFTDTNVLGGLPQRFYRVVTP